MDATLVLLLLSVLMVALLLLVWPREVYGEDYYEVLGLKQGFCVYGACDSRAVRA